MAQSIREHELGMQNDLYSNKRLTTQAVFMDVSQDYCKIKTKYSRGNYIDRFMRNNIVKYRVESRNLEATRDDRIGESKMYTKFEGKRITNLYY
jgi:hypothetical protein